MGLQAAVEIAVAVSRFQYRFAIGHPLLATCFVQHGGTQWQGKGTPSHQSQKDSGRSMVAHGHMMSYICVQTESDVFFAGLQVFECFHMLSASWRHRRLLRTVRWSSPSRLQIPEKQKIHRPNAPEFLRTLPSVGHAAALRRSTRSSVNPQSAGL